MKFKCLEISLKRLSLHKIEPLPKADGYFSQAVTMATAATPVKIAIMSMSVHSPVTHGSAAHGNVYAFASSCCLRNKGVGPLQHNAHEGVRLC